MLPKARLLVVLMLLPITGCKRQHPETHKELTTANAVSATREDAGNTEPSPPSRFEISTAAFLGVKTPQEATAKLAQEDRDLFTELGNGASGSAAKREKPTNCREWRGIKSKGYLPLSDLAQEVDDGAKVFCEALELLEKAQPARLSHVRKIDWDASIFEVLPPDIHPATSPEDRERIREASEKRLSFKQFRPAAKFERIRKELEGERFFRIEDLDANSVILGRFLAFADVDGDGIDDMLISIINLDAESEQFLEQRLFALTAKGDRQVLKVVRVE